MAEITAVMVVTLHERDPMERGGQGAVLTLLIRDLRCSARAAERTNAPNSKLRAAIHADGIAGDPPRVL